MYRYPYDGTSLSIRLACIRITDHSFMPIDDPR
jgi:hypothetical protein